MRWIMGIMEALGYPGLFLAMMLEEVFPPIPSEIILPFAGFLISRGSFTLPGAVGASAAGTLAGALFLFVMGRLLGDKGVYNLARSRFSPVSEAALGKAGRWFDRYGPFAVFFCRMVPALRSLISIPAGMAGMKPWTFTVWTIGGTLFWNTVLISLGAALGAAWLKAAGWLGGCDRIILAACLLALMLMTGRWFLKRPARKGREELN